MAWMMEKVWQVVMIKYVEWSEPWQYGENPTEHVEVVSRMKVEDVVKYYRGLHTETYKDKADDYPLDDFMQVYWAKIVEVGGNDN